MNQLIRCRNCECEQSPSLKCRRCGKEFPVVQQGKRPAVKILTFEESEKAAIHAAMTRYGAVGASKALGIDRATLYRRRRRYGLINTKGDWSGL